MKRIFFAFLALFAANFLSAQASLDIVLLDQNNNEVPFQGLQVSNPSIGYQKQIATNENGKVQLYGLSTSGKYSIEVLESAFYHPIKKENIVLISGKATSVTLTLTEKTQALDVATVSGDNYVSINAVNAEVASSLDAREISTLPVEGRDITRALYRLPNITQATGFYPEAPNIAINGANPLYTNYQIDGMDNNENFLGGQRFAMPIGFTQNITALTNNFSAEHGLSSNGIINITTKSGTNETAGEVFYMTRPGAVIDSPSEFALRDLSGNQVKDGFQRHQVGFGLGGAITQNKTFYYLNVEHTLDIKDNLLNVPQLGINETVQGRNTFTYLSGKLDHNWGERFQTSLRVNTGLSNIERQGGGLEGGVNFPSAGNTQARNAMNIALKNTVRRTNFIYEGNFLYGRFRWNYATPEDEGSPNVTVLDPQGLTMAVLGHPGYVFDVTENTQVVQQKLTFLRENHTIKTGVQYKRSNFALFGGGNPNGSYTVQLNEDQLSALQSNNPGIGLLPQDLPGDVSVLNYGVELRPNAFEANQNIFSIYIEDQWAIAPRLNANIGLRYDYDDLSKGGNDTGDLNNIAPRLSLNYTINEQSSVRLGYGMYYDKILYALYSDALQFNSNSEGYKAQLQALIDQGVLPEGSNIDALTNEGNLTANDPNAAYLEGPLAADLQDQRNEVFQNELRILNPNGYDNPYSHQFMVGYQRKVDEELS
ncbi:MAG: TonB-dependent receptor, partial [Flavobacteriales bacterium]|nr:TonB-dependent receptor [Flavobacteriales bacterium]